MNTLSQAKKMIAIFAIVLTVISVGAITKFNSKANDNAAADSSISELQATFTASNQSPIALIDSTHLSVDVTGGTAPYTYNFGTIFDNEEIIFDANNTRGYSDFKPAQDKLYDSKAKSYVGIHTLFVDITDAAGNTLRKTIKNYEVKPMKIVDFKSNLGNCVTVGSTVTLTSKTQYEATYRYARNEFYVAKQGSDDFKRLNDYLVKYTATWTPTKAGVYTLKYFVEDRLDQTDEKCITIIVTDKPATDLVTIYYRGYNTPYIHYQSGTDAWTTGNGYAMGFSAKYNYYPYTISIPVVNSNIVTLTFNDGNGNWDNNYGNNYVLTAGEYTYENGKFQRVK